VGGNKTEGQSGRKDVVFRILGTSFRALNTDYVAQCTDTPIWLEEYNTYIIRLYIVTLVSSQFKFYSQELWIRAVW